MATVLAPKKRHAKKSRKLTWEIAQFFPRQGEWTEDDYLALERSNGNWLIELADGCLEIRSATETKTASMAELAHRSCASCTQLSQS